MKETKKRSMLKSITFRIVATIITIILVLIFTKKMDLAIGIGLVDLFSKLGIYYVHERVWDKINWGLKA